MKVPEKLKLNKFVHVRIPSNETFFQRFGRQTPSEGMYSGEDPLPTMRQKLDAIAEEFDNWRKFQESGETPDN